MADESTAPWDADLEERFDDPDVREAVSEYLQDTIQPHITKLEQASSGDRQAQQLWDAFQENPIETYKEVTRELYGDERALEIAKLIEQGASTEEAVDATAPDSADEQDEALKLEQLPAEVQEAVARQQQEEQRDAYYGEIERLQTEHADELPKTEDGEPELDVDLFHPFVLAAEGDFDRAYEGYSKWMEQAKERFGIQVPETVGEPPPAMDSTTASPATTPPVEKSYESLDDAMDDFFAEQKTAPPTV